MGFVCVLVGFVLFLCDTYLPVLSYNCLGDFCLWIFALCTSAVWRITGWVWGEILHSIPLCGFKQYSNILPLRATDCDLWRRWNLTQLFRGPVFFFFVLVHLWNQCYITSFPAEISASSLKSPLTWGFFLKSTCSHYVL